MTDLAQTLEHTLLRPDTTLPEVRHLCEEAQQYGFGGVCIPPLFVRDARRMLGEDSRIRVVTVIAFPMGYSAIAAKSEEIKRAIDDGADDVDAVINLAAVKSALWNHVEHDIDSVARAAHMRGRTLKLILECGMLNSEELKRLCELADTYRIKWLKTGTGFHGYPATPDMVRQLRTLAAPSIRIKASGGIRTLATAQALLDAGADCLGTSASIELIKQAKTTPHT